MIDTHRRHQVEFGVSKRNVQRVRLNTGFDSGDLLHHPVHHPGGNITACCLLECRLKQLEQLPFSATYVHITEARSSPIATL